MRVLVGGDGPDHARWVAAVQRAGGTPIDVPGLIPADVIPTTDAAILSGSARSILDAARALGPRTPLFVVPHASGADVAAYALLPDVEDGRLVTPGWSARHAPAVTEYLRRFTAGEFGDVRLVQFDRSEPPAGAPAQVVPQPMIDERFLEDIDLLRLIGGDFHRITAVPVVATAAGCARMTVNLATAAGAEAVWSIAPGGTRSWTLQVTGSDGTARLERVDIDPVTLAINGIGVPLMPVDPDVAAVQQFLSAAMKASQPSGTPSETGFLAPAAQWSDYVRAADLWQGLHRSLRRRRTIDLHFESTSERSQFKTQMTAIGCGVLTWSFLGTCLGLVLGSALDPRDSTERRASAAGTIVWVSDFGDQEASLQPEAASRLVDRVRREGEQAIVLIEPADAPELGRVDADRLSVVETLLRQSEETRRAQITVRPLAGRWYHALMLTIWIVTFLPLGLFLLSQLLLGLTRGSDAKPVS